MTYSQRFTGIFTAYAVKGTPHCGVEHGRISCPVTIEVGYRAGAGVLDQNGFLMDNTWFRQYVADFADTRLTVSCERLAAMMAQQVLECCGDRGEWCKVSLEPVAGVQVIVEHRVSAKASAA